MIKVLLKIFVIIDLLLMISAKNRSDYRVHIWAEIQCLDSPHISHVGLSSGFACEDIAIATSHTFFFNISFASVPYLQACYICESLVSTRYYTGICRDESAIFCLYHITYSKEPVESSNIQRNHENLSNGINLLGSLKLVL
jgi:hypothetical protein